MKKVVMLSWKHLDNAYSCLLYLKKSLEKYTDVELWSRTDPKLLDNEYSLNTHDFCSTWYGKVHYIRNFIAQADVFFKALRRKNTVYIINDWDFLIPLYLAKKINKSIKVVHYCTEIPGEDCYCFPPIEKFYQKHANYPDLIIECLKERAAWRKAKYHINKKIYYIDNTPPYTELVQLTKPRKKYLDFEKNLPILVYAGGANLSRQIKEVINCIDEFKNEVNFCFFCYGSKEDLKALKGYFETQCNYNNYRLYNAIPRNELFAVMRNCQIGINYYKPDYSVNHHFAAPGKFFEYMACGLNIISTNNEGINHIVKEYNLGVCINENESVGNALHRLLNKGLTPKKEIMKLFKDKYCYENDSSEAMKKILELIS